ncbi:MAG: short-chain dehydrogenase [Calditrichaeota bacterium]|nr:short-chain dehydrogenase [Calditrichota bacterium]
MEIKGKKALILGGWGLVGQAVCRRMIEEQPSEMVILSLLKWQAEEAVQLMRKLSSDITFTPEWGNIFVRDSLKDLPREEILNNPKNRAQLMTDVLDDLSHDIINRSYLAQVVLKHKPDIIVDCINSATALAYQDIFTSSIEVQKVLENVKKCERSEESVSAIERLLITQYTPQLIRHIQILYESMKKAKTRVYVKIGTSGTGGMGLNIPYTHSEEKPSRMLLSKSAIAGSHTLLLWLMARTPDAPITKEIKPTAAIAWKKIEYGEIRKNGKPVMLYDCPPENAIKLKGTIHRQMKKGPWKPLNKPLKKVYIDTGENGIFSFEEFTAITSRGQMEFITPEEIANVVLWEIKGGNTGHDIINALDNATMGPTYRAGYLRGSALQKMLRLQRDHKSDSVAFELLGPPKLSKLLYEAYLLKRCKFTMEEVLKHNPEFLANCAEELIKTDHKLRAEILSIGIPILMSDGKKLLRGPEMKIPAYKGINELEVTQENINKWASEGWLDLRAENFKIWQERIRKIQKEIESVPEDDTSSQYDRDREYWNESNEIEPGKIVGWLFLQEEQGLRMKD